MLAANREGRPLRAALFAERIERARRQAAGMGEGWLRGSPRIRMPIVVVTRQKSRIAFSLPAPPHARVGRIDCITAKWQAGPPSTYSSHFAASVIDFVESFAVWSQ